MLLYSAIMLLVGAALAAVGIAIYKGKTELIHEYHRERVKDRVAYGKAFGKSMLMVSGSLLISGAVGLLGDSDAIVTIALWVLFVGLLTGILCIIAVQKRFNNGIF